MRYTIALVLLLLFNIVQGQTTYFADSFNGGVTTGGFPLGSSTFGMGSFNATIPAGSTIRQAYFFATSITDPGAYTVTLNGTAYTFDNTNLIQTFNSGLGLASIHAIDITNAVNVATTAYTIQANFEANISEFYSDFYLYIAYDNPNSPVINTYIYTNDMDMQSNMSMTLGTTAPIPDNVPVGLAIVGGYADGNNPTGDCQNVEVNGTNLGGFHGADNNAASTNGAIASFAYVDVNLNGLGDDSSDQPIDGSDALSNLQGLLPDDTMAVDVSFSHCTPGMNDNIVWMMLLNFSEDTCQVRNINIGNDTALCIGKTIDVNAKINANATYTWSTGSTDTAITITVPGTYSVIIDVNSCEYKDTMFVAEITAPALEIGNDTTLCEGESFVLDASHNTTSPHNTTYIWADGTPGPIKTIDRVGNHILEINVGGCINQDTMVANYILNPVVSIGNDTAVCEKNTIPISLPTEYTYLWNDGSTSSAYEITEAGRYEVIASNTCGNDTASIEVIIEDCDCILYMPNAFSPNNDSKNDVFLPVTECEVIAYQLQIFNRWGVKVFESVRPEDGWDGTFNGTAQMKDIYVYQMSFVSPFTKKRTEKVGRIFLVNE